MPWRNPREGRGEEEADESVRWWAKTHDVAPSKIGDSVLLKENKCHKLYPAYQLLRERNHDHCEEGHDKVLMYAGKEEYDNLDWDHDHLRSQSNEAGRRERESATERAGHRSQQSDNQVTEGLRPMNRRIKTGEESRSSVQTRLASTWDTIYKDFEPETTLQ